MRVEQGQPWVGVGWKRGLVLVQGGRRKEERNSLSWDQDQSGLPQTQMLFSFPLEFNLVFWTAVECNK